ncbi:MAG: RNA 2',3'-cyclic phosphodiesterase [Salinisphaera sp.]|uniref:RNA 2',3'-cyclic phosphodiesterase n=1 Tax=Salinisphaera sp. TaxID=1914330 RepID=UPI003C7BDD1A
MACAGEPKRQRLFFALWPPPDIAERIADTARALETNGMPVACDKLHVTLAFHGACSVADRDALIARAERAVAPPIDLVFDRLGGFEKPRLIWLGMSDPPQALYDLAAFLRGPALDARRFVPHITLQRKAAPISACALAPIGWRAREFVLAESGANGAPGSYRILARWPLTGEAAPSQV